MLFVKIVFLYKNIIILLDGIVGCDKKGLKDKLCDVKFVWNVY